jgi:hypothetical protein
LEKKNVARFVGRNYEITKKIAGFYFSTKLSEILLWPITTLFDMGNNQQIRVAGMIRFEKNAHFEESEET